MARASVTTVGMLRLSEDGPPECSIDVNVGKGNERRTVWLSLEEEIPNSSD